MVLPALPHPMTRTSTVSSVFDTGTLYGVYAIGGRWPIASPTNAIMSRCSARSAAFRVARMDTDACWYEYRLLFLMAMVTCFLR